MRSVSEAGCKEVVRQWNTEVTMKKTVHISARFILLRSRFESRKPSDTLTRTFSHLTGRRGCIKAHIQRGVSYSRSCVYVGGVGRVVGRCNWEWYLFKVIECNCFF